MKRRAFVCALLAAVCVPVAAWAQRGGMQAELSRVLDGIDFSALQRAMDGMLGTGGEWSARSLIDQFARGQVAIDAGALLKRLLAMLLAALRAQTTLAISLLIPAVLCSVIVQLRAAFEKDTVAQLSHYACFVLVCVPMVRSLVAHIDAVRHTADGMVGGMQALFPILLTLLAAVGGHTSSAFFQPAVMAASGAMTATVRDVTLNLAMCFAAVTVVGHLSDRVHLGRLAGLLRTVANWTLGVCFTVFIGVMTVQGMGAAVADGVSIRTAKYAIDNFVPIIGGMFSDTVDTLVGCSLLVKNAVGIFGLMSLVLYIATPLVNLAVTILVFKLCAALLEPVADGNIVACIGDFSQVLTLVFVTLLCVGAMFFLLVAQLLVVGNLTVMMR